MKKKNKSRRTFIKKIFAIGFYPLIFKSGIGVFFLTNKMVLKKKYDKFWILKRNDY